MHTQINYFSDLWMLGTLSKRKTPSPWADLSRWDIKYAPCSAECYVHIPLVAEVLGIEPRLHSAGHMLYVELILARPQVLI